MGYVSIVALALTVALLGVPIRFPAGLSGNISGTVARDMRRMFCSPYDILTYHYWGLHWKNGVLVLD